MNRQCGGVFPSFAKAELSKLRKTAGVGGFPSFAKEGWLRHKEKWPRSLFSADGVVVQPPTVQSAFAWISGGLKQLPRPLLKGCFAAFFFRSRPPLLREGMAEHCRFIRYSPLVARRTGGLPFELFGVDDDPIRHISCAQMIAVALILMFLSQASTPEQKAVGYMQEAVPHWPMENHCFSCHNNGDGARALLLAYRMKYTVPAASLEGTLDWLQKPNEWGQSGTTGFGDEKLARIQFGAALVDALDAGVVSDKNLLARVAGLLLPHQEADGSWQVDANAASPSAVTYGPTLATFMARRTLERAGDTRFDAAIARADNLAAPLRRHCNRERCSGRARLRKPYRHCFQIQA